MAKRRACKGTTKKGKRCKAHPLKDTDRCIAHSDEETRGSTGFGGPQEGSGRPRLPRTMEVARRLVEDNAAVLLRPHLRTLGFDVTVGDDGPQLVEYGTGAKVHATYEGQVVMSPHDDLGAMMAAAERLLDRVYGKPRQAMEHTGAGGGPVEVSSDLSRLSVEEKRALLVLLEKAGEGDG